MRRGKGAGDGTVDVSSNFRGEVASWTYRSRDKERRWEVGGCRKACAAVPVVYLP